MQTLRADEAISAKPKRPLRLTAEVNSAATQMSGIYGIHHAVNSAEFT